MCSASFTRRPAVPASEVARRRTPWCSSSVCRSETRPHPVGELNFALGPPDPGTGEAGDHQDGGTTTVQYPVSTWVATYPLVGTKVTDEEFNPQVGATEAQGGIDPAGQPDVPGAV